MCAREGKTRWGVSLQFSGFVFRREEEPPFPSKKLETWFAWMTSTSSAVVVVVLQHPSSTWRHLIFHSFWEGDRYSLPLKRLKLCYKSRNYFLVIVFWLQESTILTASCSKPQRQSLLHCDKSESFIKFNYKKISHSYSLLLNAVANE